MELAAWLRRSGLEQYQSVLVSNAIDVDVLRDLTEADLEKLGLPLGDRKRLLRAVAEMLAGVPAAVAESAAGGRRDAPRGTAERRHLTIMLCDLVGSTPLSARLDPEDLRAVMDAYHAACARICVHYEGFITEFKGDGILAFFGYPHAHEDDAERAITAGLEIIGALARIDIPGAGPLTVRIGIATGLVVIGDSGGEAALGEHLVAGETPNIAARLQMLAEPGTIVVAASTRRLVGNLFRFRDLGPQQLKGFDRPVAAWVVEGIAASVSRFGSIRTAGLTAFVGRDGEIEFLLQQQQRAWTGEGQVVVITGEPGIGKSRLAVTLAERIAAQSYTTLTFQCSPSRTNSALHPVIAYLERAAGFRENDAAAQRLDKLEQLLSATMTSSDADVPLFAALLSIPLDGRYPPLALNPTEQRQRTLAAIMHHLDVLARRRPILLVFEDAHWADATSLELFDQVVAGVPRRPILALVTIRPGMEPPWTGLPNVHAMALGRLERDAVESMTTQILGGRRLPAEVMSGIVAKTDGNPLFLEELTKAVLESGCLLADGDDRYRIDRPLPRLAIPSTLHDSLMARLDRSEPMKRIAQIGAAIGREFSFSLLRAVVDDDEPALLVSLGQLEQAGLVFRRGDPPDATYIFKHALVRDAAYESLLKTRRQGLHQRIARALEAGFPAVAATAPELVAHHLIEANLSGPAVDYLLAAGTLALTRSANAEAVEHLRLGLALTRQQPPAPGRDRKELDFHLVLAPALAATGGYAAPGTLEVLSKARELLGDGGTPTEQMTVLWGTYLAHNMRAEHAASLEVARQCLALGEQHRNPGVLAMAHRFMGQTLNLVGSLAEARWHLERAIAVCAANATTVAAYRRFGIDDQVGAMFNLARTLLLLGYPDQSAAEAERAVTRAHGLALPFTTALALAHATIVGILASDRRRLGAHLDDAISFSAKHGLPEPEQKARFMRGAFLARTGDPATGLEIMRHAMAAESRAVPGRIAQYHSLYIGQIADAHFRLGDARAGLDLLETAIADTTVTGERFFSAELFRLRAKMLLALGAARQAEASLHEALAIAQQQGARWWELRAAMSLAAMWHGEGRSVQARALLQPVHDGFSEGFGTSVLRRARVLLDQLAEPAIERQRMVAAAPAGLDGQPSGTA